jgi:hypothetical protein
MQYSAKNRDSALCTQRMQLKNCLNLEAKKTPLKGRFEKCFVLDVLLVIYYVLCIVIVIRIRM